MQLPITMPGLGHVNCYALEDERGVAVVDPGSARPGAVGRPRRPARCGRHPAGAGAHRDRHPLAPRPLRRGGAASVTRRAPTSSPTSASACGGTRTEIDAEDPESAPDDQSDGPPSGGPWDRPLPWGGRARLGQPGRDDDLAPRGDAHPHAGAAPVTPAGGRPGRRRSPGGSGWPSTRPGTRWTTCACTTRLEGVVLSGDHVLPTITPHISGVDGAGDPLALFFDSLDRMTKLEDVTIVLPAHGHPFNDLTGRVDAIKQHHDERLGAAGGGVGRDRPLGVGRGADAAPVLGAGVGLDGRERDVRPPRAPPPERATPTRTGKTTSSSTT